MTSKKNERIANLILFFLSENPGAGRTQIIKFLYLSDLEYRQYQGEPITDLEYIWGDHGPFDPRVYVVLDQMKADGTISEEPYANAFGKPAYRYKSEISPKSDGLHRAELRIAESVAKQVRDTPLRNLLDEVVYQTMPMLDAQDRDARGQKLRMELVNNQKRKFMIDLKDAFDAEESFDKNTCVSGKEFFEELLRSCPG